MAIALVILQIYNFISYLHALAFSAASTPQGSYCQQNFKVDSVD